MAKIEYRTSRVWTDAEVERLKEYYRTTHWRKFSVRKIANELHRTQDAVRRKAVELGVTDAKRPREAARKARGPHSDETRAKQRAWWNLPEGMAQREKNRTRLMTDEFEGYRKQGREALRARWGHGDE